MNIGFFFMHPPGESMGSIVRLRSLCQGLSKLTHKCYIFTPFNYLENWGPLVKFITIPFIKSPGNLSKYVYKSVRRILDIKILSNFLILNPRGFDLTLSHISRGLLNTLYEHSFDFDVIIGENEIGGLILSKIKDKIDFPIVADYHNYWPEELVEHKIIKRYSRRYKYLIMLEQKIINEADGVITVSKTLKSFLDKNFSDLSKPKTEFIEIGGLPLLDKPKRKSNPPKLINSGMVVHRSNFKLFFDSMPYVLKEFPDTEIYITRKGEKLKETIALAKKKKININFYWKDTYQEFIDLLSTCHIGVVTSTNQITRKLGFVTKIHDYFSVGIPAVGNDIGGWSSIISKENVGLLSSSNPKDLAEKINYLLKNQDLMYEYGQNGINLLKTKYNVLPFAQKLIDFIRNINY